MKQESNEKKTALEYWRGLYEAALLADAERIDSMERNMRQYLGTDEIDGSDERALTVRNITYEIVESQVDPDVPLPKADAALYSEKRDKNARTVERLCASVRDLLPFEAMNDVDERYTYVYGASIWYVEWDGASADGISIQCLSPLDFIGQPGIYEIENMDYCFLRFTTTRSELSRKYGVPDEMLSLAAYEYSYGAEGADGDTVTLVVGFYKQDGEVGKIVFSGDLLISDTPFYYARKLYFCAECGEPLSACRCQHPRKYSTNLLYEQAELPESKQTVTLPYYLPKDFPIIIRRNTAPIASLYGLSDCERIRPQQQAINKVESRILQKLLRAGVTPVMPEDASVSMSNSVFGQVIKLRPGESADSYGTIDTTPDVSQDIAEADRLYDQAKRVLGISDALQGTDDPIAESGYARQLKISRAEGRLETKRRMKYHCYSELYKTVFRLYLAFADEPRSLTCRDELGRICNHEFRRADFIEPDGRGGFVYDDGYLFSVDISGGDEYGREALWERNLNNLKSGTLGDPTDPTTLLRYWRLQERAHYPYAGENTEFFEALVKSKEKENENEENEIRHGEGAEGGR